MNNWQENSLFFLIMKLMFVKGTFQGGTAYIDLGCQKAGMHVRFIAGYISQALIALYKP